MRYNVTRINALIRSGWFPGGNFIMTFQHYDFTDDTTLKVSTSDLKLSDSGEIALHQGRTVSIKWNTNQQKFVANEAQQ